MKNLIRGSQQGLRAVRGMTTRCSAQVPNPGSGAAQSAGRALLRFGAAELPGSSSSSTWNKGFIKRTFTSFRTFSSSGGGGGGAGGSGGGGGGGGGGGSGGLWAAYLALLNRKPVATKAVTAAILNGLGDIIAQVAFNEDGKFDFKRLGIFAFIGLALIGPALHVWYGSLASLVTATGTMGALGRLFLDQALFAPIFIGSIVSSIMVLEGHAAEVPDKLKNDLFTIVRSNWMLWVPFQFVNFRFVPVHLQVLAANVVALAWNTYMSYISHNGAVPAEAAAGKIKKGKK